jgi:hypothetical protein
LLISTGGKRKQKQDEVLKGNRNKIKILFNLTSNRITILQRNNNKIKILFNLTSNRIMLLKRNNNNIKI